jgi:hypothetical protein
MPRVIVKFTTGEEKTGEVMLFNVNQPTFQLKVDKGNDVSEMQNVRIDAVKAIFFLKKEEKQGTLLRTETIDNSTYAGTLAFKLVVEFPDGEIISGSTLKYTPNAAGFFLIPMNPAATSERIYVNAGAVKNVDCKRLLGKILVDQNKITTGQLTESLKYQQEQKEKKLGAILRENAMIDEKQLHQALQKQKEKNRMLGEILLEAGYITSDQLAYALTVQQENRKKKLGQVLVELKYITPNDICIALATQFHKQWIDLSQVQIASEVATSLPEEVERELEVIPVENKRPNVLVVATSQPQNTEIGTEISKHTSHKIHLVVAYEGYIEAAINTHYPHSR